MINSLQHKSSCPCLDFLVLFHMMGLEPLAVALFPSSYWKTPIRFHHIKLHVARWILPYNWFCGMVHCNIGMVCSIIWCNVHFWNIWSWIKKWISLLVILLAVLFCQCGHDCTSVQCDVVVLITFNMSGTNNPPGTLSVFFFPLLSVGGIPRFLFSLLGLF